MPLSAGGLKAFYKIFASAKILFGQFFEYDMQYKNPDADSDSAVGYIKSRPVIIPDIKIEKIDHFPEPHPVDQVADGAPENHCESGCQDTMRPRRLLIKPENQTDG